MARKSRPGCAQRERSSATREVPPELRGRRVMIRLAGLVVAARSQGVSPRVAHLSAADEALLVAVAGETFGSSAAEAAVLGTASWRAFLAGWMRTYVELDVVFDAPETRVTA